MISNELFNQYDPVPPKKTDTVFFFRKGAVGIHRLSDEEYRCPSVRETGEAELQYLFRIDDQSYFLAEEEYLPEGYAFEDLRTTRTMLPRQLSFAVMTGYHLYLWYHYHRFCGKCGEKLVHHESERKMVCPRCGHSVYPYIKPAVIVALTDGDRLLLTTQPGHTYRALVAGFCEIGESAEEAVRREVREEVGLEIGELKYFGSQPWGYNANLMIGYFAKVTGEVTPSVDHRELNTAEWVSRPDIEEQVIPSLGSEMIMYFKYHGWFDEEKPSREYFRF